MIFLYLALVVINSFGHPGDYIGPRPLLEVFQVLLGHLTDIVVLG